MYKVISTDAVYEMEVSPDNGTSLRIVVSKTNKTVINKILYNVAVFDTEDDVELESKVYDDRSEFLFKAGVLLAGTFGADVAVLAWDFLLRHL